MTRLLSFFGGWQGYAAIALACLLAGSAGTWRVMSWKEAAAVTHQAQQTVRLVEHQANITYQISATYEAVKSNDVEATSKRLEQIPVHITPDADRACVVPFGYVRVFNAATHGPVPDAASGSDAAPSGLALSDIAKVDTENAGQYDIIAAQLIALQDWIKQQQAAATK